MNTETLVTLGVVYVIGFYVTTFVVCMWDASLGIEFDYDEWFPCIAWPLFISILIVIVLVAGISKLYKLAFSRMESSFPAMARFVQRTLKCARTAIFAVSLLFRPAKFGELVGKRIRNRDAKKRQQ